MIVLYMSCIYIVTLSGASKHRSRANFGASNLLHHKWVVVIFVLKLLVIVHALFLTVCTPFTSKLLSNAFATDAYVLQPPSRTNTNFTNVSEKEVKSIMVIRSIVVAAGNGSDRSGSAQ